MIQIHCDQLFSGTASFCLTVWWINHRSFCWKWGIGTCKTCKKLLEVFSWTNTYAVFYTILIKNCRYKLIFILSCIPVMRWYINIHVVLTLTSTIIIINLPSNYSTYVCFLIIIIMYMIYTTFQYCYSSTLTVFNNYSFCRLISLNFIWLFYNARKPCLVGLYKICIPLVCK